MSFKKLKERMKCNQPQAARDGKHKKVVKACDKGKEKIVRFGHPDYKDYTQHKDKDRKKSYCARSEGLGNTTNKLSANYWARKKLWGCK
jgi:hypothetical protein